MLEFAFWQEFNSFFTIYIRELGRNRQISHLCGKFCVQDQICAFNRNSEPCLSNSRWKGALQSAFDYKQKYKIGGTRELAKSSLIRQWFSQAARHVVMRSVGLQKGFYLKVRIISGNFKRLSQTVSHSYYIWRFKILSCLKNSDVFKNLRHSQNNYFLIFSLQNLLILSPAKTFGNNS